MTRLSVISLVYVILCSRNSAEVAKDVNIKIGLLLPKNDPYLVPKIGFGTSAAAVTIALERVARERLLDRVNWSVIWESSECNEALAVGIAVRFFDREKVDVIIGPACSNAAIVAGLFGNYYDVPLISWAATTAELNDAERFPTMARTIGSARRVGRAIAELMGFFGWFEFGQLFNDDHARRMCAHVHAGMEEALRDTDIVNTVEMRIDGAGITDAQIDDFFRRAQHHARVIVVCLDHPDDKRHFMLRTLELGVNTAEWVYIMPDYLPDAHHAEPWVDYRPNTDGRDALAKSAFDKALIVPRPVFFSTKLAVPIQLEFAQLESAELQEFKEAIPAKMKEWPFFYNTSSPDEQFGSTYSPFMHDATYLYALALNKTLKQGFTKRNGRKIIDNCRNVEFDGKSGHVVIDAEASREPNFVLKGLTAKGSYEVFASLFMYKPDGEVVTLEKTEYEIWNSRGGNRPKAHPTCGFHGELCFERQDSNTTLMIGLAASFCVIIILLVIVVAYTVRFRQAQKKAQDLLWQVHFTELRAIDNDSTRSHASGSLLSLDSFSTMVLNNNKPVGQRVSQNHELFHYRGVAVLAKRHSGRPQLGQADREQLRGMRQCTSSNLCLFIGLCMDGPQVISLWEFCSKGSLQDVLDKDTVKLDWFFKFSLVRDIADGLEHIVKSHGGSHGQLSSASCMIDGRWQLKITDYDMTALKLVDKVNAKGKYWTAPELLGNEGERPLGTREGDIYSLGIIISEVITAAKAFSANSDISPEEIIYRVRKGESVPYRPVVKLPDNTDVSPTMLHLMRDCWEEKPGSRPDIKTVKAQLKTMMKGHKLSLMDHVLSVMEKYAANLELEVNERTKELVEEKKKSDVLLYRMLPRTVADKLKVGAHVDPESYEAVTIFFSDVVGFTTLASRCTPMQVVALLNELYSCYDALIDAHDVYKVETIGDSYLCASGLPHRNGDEHAEQIAELSLGFMRASATFQIPHLPKDGIQLRIGLHTGPCVAGVVGSVMPRYCLFGDAVNTASRMESHSKPGMIHLTEQAKKYLDLTKKYEIEARGEVIVKGKGVLNTYFLVGHRDDKALAEKGLFSD